MDLGNISWGYILFIFNLFALIYSLTLSERTFKTLDFYRELQDNLTPAGLAFFQTDWDDSVPEFYHNSLSMYFKINVFSFIKYIFCRYERTYFRI